MSDIKYVGVFTTKGGVGKTTISVNVAEMVGRREKVLLFEMDTNHSITSLLKVRATKISEVKKGVSPRKVGNFYLISMDGETQKAERAIPPEKIINGIGKALADFDKVIVDFPSTVSPLVLYLMDKMDFVAVPFVPSFLGLGAWYYTKNIFKILGYDSYGIFLNMCKFSLFGSKEERELLERLNREKKFMNGLAIPYDKRVLRAEKLHVPAVAEFPKSRFSKGIEKFVKRVFGGDMVANDRVKSR